jgi:hypothetical protein
MGSLALAIVVPLDQRWRGGLLEQLLTDRACWKALQLQLSAGRFLNDGC